MTANRSKTRKYKSPGRTGQTKLRKTHTMEEIRKLKQELLDILSNGLAQNITEACEMMGVKPYLAHSWKKRDEDWSRDLELCKEVLADRLEKELSESPNIIAKIFLLKGLRPHIYRDNYHKPETSETVVETIKELRRLANEQKEIEAPRVTTEDTHVEAEYHEIPPQLRMPDAKPETD